MKNNCWHDEKLKHNYLHQLTNRRNKMIETLIIIAIFNGYFDRYRLNHR